MKEISEKKLYQILKAQIRSEGAISFRDYMEKALYDPELGYYSSNRIKIGWEGDFFTSSDLHKAFGTLVMKQLHEMWEIFGRNNPIHIIEAGGGKGNLCAHILDGARRREPDFFNALHYIIVERSPYHITLQQKLFKERGLERKVSWADEIGSALTGTIPALVLSNELIDALPVHRVRFNGNEWEEIFVDITDDAFAEITSPLSHPDLNKFLNGLEGPFEEGYKTEVNLEGIRWIENVGKAMKKGFVITIDYGYPSADYYSPLRCDGTLLSYHQHQISENPYERIGEQDITAHVDFTSLAVAGKTEGLEVTGFCEQFHFLMGMGIFDELNDMGATESFDIDAYQENQAMKGLFMPESMGGTFKLLIQHKGIEKPDLKAFSFKDISHRL